MTNLDCKKCDNPCIILNSKSKIEARHNEPFCCYFKDHELTGSFDDLLEGIIQRVTYACKTLYPSKQPPSDQSLRNLRGAWFETAIAVISWNASVEHNNLSAMKIAVLKFPPASRIQWWDIFDNRAKIVLDEGLFRSLKKVGIKMTLPNPDLLCIGGINENIANLIDTATVKPTLDFIRKIEKMYEFVKETCPYNSLKFGLSVKNELKPDRRYLIVYEGSLVKAIISHLQMRFWDITFDTKYYGLVHKPLSSQDKIVYTNPSIDSIVDVHAKPRKAVDEIIACEEVSDAQEIIKKWIESG
ncbi:MAG: Cfr10I/Bse634I family restriction endonuclease [Candidatus Bathyarchaeota archaeon]|nr:Cfr10I/Bse634I family restriction endonuclease [Candidatus Bathyarchaeota archaeon]